MPLGARVGALVVDLAPAFGPVVAAGAIGSIWFDRGSRGMTDLEPAAGIAVIVAALWPVVYFGRERTIGKWRLGAWVSGPTPLRRRLRGLWALIPSASAAWPFLLPLLAVDFVWTFFDRRRALHDRIAATEVLREVRESPRIRELRRAGADARRAYALAALEWAVERAASAPGLEEIRRAVDAAALDPYEATAAWGRATTVVAEPLEDRITPAELEDPDFVDPGLERLYEEADAAEERARRRLLRARA